MSNEESKQQPTATVNGEVVPQGLVSQEREWLEERYRQQMTADEFEGAGDRLETDALENAIERLLLIQLARDKYPEMPPKELNARYLETLEACGGNSGLQEALEETGLDEQRLRDFIRDQWLYEQYVGDLAAEVPEPDEAACRKAYEDDRDLFLVPERVRVSHILKQPGPDSDPVALQAELLNLRERVIKGEEFTAMAREHGDDGSDGDVGWFSRGDVIEEFENVAFSIRPGQVSDVVATRFGLHLLQVTDREAERMRTFEEVHEELRAHLHEEIRNAHIGVQVDALVEQAEIVRDA